MKAHKETGQAVGADGAGRAGRVRAADAALARRAGRAAGCRRRLFNLVVTNVPGPQFPLYAGGRADARGVPGRAAGQGPGRQSIGLTSYDGGVFYGLNADRDAMPDVDVLAECLQASIEELLDTVPAPSATVTPTRGQRREPGARPRTQARERLRVGRNR